MMTLAALERAFWSQVHVCAHGHGCTTCCWPWLGRKNRAYGCLKVDGELVSAHRIALELAKGACLLPWIPGCFSHAERQPLRICGLHRCDNPPCVNWHHLFPGTYQDNMRDAQQKGRRKRALGVSADYLLGLIEEEHRCNDL